MSRTVGSDGAVSVQYATSDGTATTGDTDYDAASGTLNWPDGDVADKTFTVTINGDTTEETDETVNLTLSSVTGSATLGDAAATLTIQNDDEGGELAFNSATFSETEGDSGTRTATITVSRTVGSDGAVSVQYATSETRHGHDRRYGLRRRVGHAELGRRRCRRQDVHRDPER